MGGLPRVQELEETSKCLEIMTPPIVNVLTIKLRLPPPSIPIGPAPRTPTTLPDPTTPVLLPLPLTPMPVLPRVPAVPATPVSVLLLSGLGFETVEKMMEIC